MFSLIPLDVWAATALAAIVALLAIFGPSLSVFIAIYFCLCAYIVYETIHSEHG